MPLSSDPEKRARQLSNLNGPKGLPTSGSFSSPATPNLRHGLRSRNPPRIVLDPLVAEIEDALAADLPLQVDGQVPGPDRFAVELAALALLRVRRVSAFLELHGDEDSHGSLRPELDGLGRAIEQAARMLDRLGMSPRARVALGLDVVRGASAGSALAAHLAANYGTAEVDAVDQVDDDDTEEQQ